MQPDQLAAAAERVRRVQEARGQLAGVYGEKAAALNTHAQNCYDLDVDVLAHWAADRILSSPTDDSPSGDKFEAWLRERIKIRTASPAYNPHDETDELCVLDLSETLAQYLALRPAQQQREDKRLSELARVWRTDDYPNVSALNAARQCADELEAALGSPAGEGK